MASFEPDAELDKWAEAYSLDMIDYAANNFGIVLDWSDASIRLLEEIGGAMHARFKEDRPSHEDMLPVAKAIGCYLGEVMRKNHQAQWGWVDLGGERVTGMRGAGQGVLFWPVGKAEKRIVDGHEDNLHFYFIKTLESDASRPGPAN